VHEVHSGVPGQKISVSAAGGPFNPCARPFGPFDQTNLQSNPWFRDNVSMSLHSWIKDMAHCVEVPGRQASIFPSFGSFLVY